MADIWSLYLDEKSLRRSVRKLSQSSLANLVLSESTSFVEITHVSPNEGELDLLVAGDIKGRRARVTLSFENPKENLTRDQRKKLFDVLKVATERYKTFDPGKKKRKLLQDARRVLVV